MTDILNMLTGNAAFITRPRHHQLAGGVVRTRAVLQHETGLVEEQITLQELVAWTKEKAAQ
jgi:hypothetical protein